MEPTSPVAQRRSPAVGVFADTAYVLNGRVDELALYKRLLTAEERAWLSRNNGQYPADLIYAYGDPAHAHAATALGDNKYQYDAKGNMSVRWISGTRTMLAYDADTVPAGGNRMIGVTTCPDADGLGCDAPETQIAQFTYDGDTPSGHRRKAG